MAKTAAGACEYVPVAKVNNIAQTIGELQKEGLWIASGDMDGEMAYSTALTGPIALVIGGEHEGVSRLVREKKRLYCQAAHDGTCEFVECIRCSGCFDV